MGRYWKKHPRKDLEQLLEEFDQAGWRIEDPPTYYHVLCPKTCGNHQRWIHLTPSGASYGRNASAWLHRQPCYNDRPEEGTTP